MLLKDIFIRYYQIHESSRHVTRKNNTELSDYWKKCPMQREYYMLALGLIQEVGETYMEHRRYMTNDKNPLILELGDVCWYTISMSKILKYDLVYDTLHFKQLDKNHEKIYRKLFLQSSIIAGRLKKICRGDLSITSCRHVMVGCCQKIFNHLLCLCDEYDVTINEILDENLKKIKSRYNIPK